MTFQTRRGLRDDQLHEREMKYREREMKRSWAMGKSKKRGREIEGKVIVKGLEGDMEIEGDSG